jgi:outer membrane protein assembly factor BamB/tRNA A-37 threonylcarbamoyl transferase component Bud32
VSDQPLSFQTQHISPGHTTTLPHKAVLQNRYEIIRVIGVGGMGAVYQARDRRFSSVTKLCAVKEMINTTTDPRMRQLTLENFAREANILATLAHPSIPKIFDFFSEGERSYLVMEFIDGRDLEAILDATTGFLDERQVAEWAVQICDVLQYLHSQRPNPIVFRDLKPSNIMVNPRNWVMLVDFGIAKVFQVGEKGTMIGTEGYSPPEQYRGVAEPRGDIYALGATLHHLLTKSDPRLEPPFTFHERPPRQLNPQTTPAMDALITKALEYEPEKRYASATEMRSALQNIASPTNSAKPRLSTYLLSSEDRDVSPVWQFTCEDEVRSSPRVNGGTVYVGAYDNNLYSLEAKTGKLIWKYPTEGGICSSPGVWENNVYIGSEDHFFYCIRADSGRIVWSYPTKGRIRSSARVALDHVFFGSDDGYLYTVNARSGREAWRYQANSPIRSTPCVWEDLVFFGCNDGGVYALDIQSGQNAWKFRTAREVTSSPTAAANLLVVGSNDWSVYALDPRSGFNIWRRRTNQAIVASPAILDDRIFVGSVDTYLYCLDTRTGRIVWKFHAGGQITSSAAVTPTAVYFGCVDGHLYKLDQKTGGLIWQVQTGGPIPSSPALGDDLVFIGSTDNKVYAFPL